MKMFPINLTRGFNPRTREGCDLANNIVKLVMQVSIHAPAKGATGLLTCVDGVALVSIHAPAKGATKVKLVLGTKKRFNPRTREGCDAYLCLPCRVHKVSIHAPAKGATLIQVLL